MPHYDYRCTECGAELEIFHKMSESVSHRAHNRPDSEKECNELLERLIAMVGVNREVGQKPLTDQQIERAGFTKYVRGAKGYEKAAGPPGSPDFFKRE